MRRFVPLLAILLAPPTVLAAPKNPSSKKKTTKAMPAPPKATKAYKNPCPDVTFTPDPIVLQGVYASNLRHSSASPLSVSVQAKQQGVGVLLWGDLSSTAGDGSSNLDLNSFHRLDEIPTRGNCQVAEERTLSGSVGLTNPANPTFLHDRIVSEVNCEPGATPRCELVFEPMTIAMEPRHAGCGHETGTIAWRSTVVARRVGAAPRRALPSIDIRFDTHNVSSGKVQRGVLTAVGPRPKGRKRAPMYRGTFDFDHVFNPEVISTLYPGCAADQPLPPRAPTRFTPSTSKQDALMPVPEGGGFVRSVCSWRGRGRGRVLACHLSTPGIRVPLTDSLH